MTAPQWQGRKGRPWRRIRQAILIRDERTCQLCSHPIDDDQPGEVDHIQRRADGGDADMANLRAAHGSSSPCFACDPVRGRPCNQLRPSTAQVHIVHVDATTL